VIPQIYSLAAESKGITKSRNIADLTPFQQRFVGDCAESEHLRDDAAETLRTKREKERQLKCSWKQSNKDFLLDGMLNGSYTKYLKCG
jgi:hypothetical protein